MLSIIILTIVLALIAVRQIGNMRLQIWQIMLIGAVAVLLTGQISPSDALKAINIDVLVFLFGMFVVGQALETSGYLSHLSYSLFKNTQSTGHLLLFVIFGAGFASALLMNDTLAIIGTPVMLLLARKHNLPSKMLLLALAFSITIGSVMSPIGNPQNLLIALNGDIGNPFITFLKYLLFPTVVNLFAAYFLLKFFYKNHFRYSRLNHSREPIRDRRLAVLSFFSLLIAVILVLVKVAFLFIYPSFDFRLTYIAIGAALPIIFFSPRRFEMVKSIDWSTLVFFAAMFVLMESVWEVGVFQSLIAKSQVDITSVGMIIFLSIGLSQLISNVPLVALYLPMLAHAGASAKEMIALAAGSTIAGNLMILGAASNVIIIQNAENKSGETLSFLEFVRFGVPLTIINAFVYWLFLSI